MMDKLVKNGKNNTIKADLHMHSNASGDAFYTPEDLFKRAKEAGIGAISFTDHNSNHNNKEGLKLSKEYGIEFLSGVEVSSSWRGKAVDVLAFFYNSTGEFLQPYLDLKIRKAKRNSAEIVIERMIKSGIQITLKEYDEIFENCTTGDMPLLRLMIKKKYVTDLFDYGIKLKEFHSENDPNFTPATQEVIKEIHKAGGVAVLAHPNGTNEHSFYQFKKDDIERSIEWGIDGIEIFHFFNENNMKEVYLNIAKEHNLLITGGSDTHGFDVINQKDNEIGPYWCDWNIIKSKLSGH